MPAYSIENGKVTIFPVDHEAVEIHGPAANYFQELVRIFDTKDLWISLVVEDEIDTPGFASAMRPVPPDSLAWKYEFLVSIDPDAYLAFDEATRSESFFDLIKPDFIKPDTVWIDPDPVVRWDAWFVADATRSQIIECSPRAGHPPYQTLPECNL